MKNVMAKTEAGQSTPRRSDACHLIDVIMMAGLSAMLLAKVMAAHAGIV